MTTDNLESAAIKAAGRAARTSNSQREIPSEITLSNGIVLEVSPMPPMLLNSVMNSVPVPDVPKVWLEDKQREEENPNHPAYIQALQDRQLVIAKATADLIMAACTKVKYVPDGVVGPKDDSWLRLAKMAMIDFNPADEIERYLAWMRVYAVATLDDMNKTQSIPLQLAGISEAEVEEVTESFRSGEERGTDPEPPVEESSPDGDNLREIDSGNRTRARRA
jgi:hypothetical protein